MITLYGAKWCPDCVRSKKLLDELKVEYIYIDLQDTPEAADIVTRINNGLQSIPTIVFDDKSTLVEPSNNELRKKLAEQGVI